MTLPANHERYLRLLEIDGVPEGSEGLTRVVRQHLTRVPFENLSKLYRNRRSGLRQIPDLPSFLDGIEYLHLGGTCYANNYHLNSLLRVLGYDAALCAADMAHPDVHLANIVRLDGREYVVDAGYGAPFLTPLPRDLDHDYEVVLGNERYVLKPRDAEGRSRLELHRNGKHLHGYMLKPAPRRIDEFERVIEDSFAPSATFMNALVIVRFFPGRSLVLHNLTLIESEGTASRVQRIPHASHLPEVIERHFHVPAAVTAEALNGLSLTQDPWSDSAAGEGGARGGHSGR